MSKSPAAAATAPVDDLLRQAWELRHEDTREALALNRRAYQWAWDLGYLRGVAVALLRVALCHVILGDDDALAEMQAERAAALLRALDECAGEAEALNLSAHLHLRRSDHRAALEAYGSCLALRRRVGDRLGESHALNNLALVLLDAHRHADALELALASLEVAREVEDEPAQAYAMNLVGRVLAATGDAQSALDHFERSLTLIARSRDRAFESSARVSLGQALAGLGRHEAALPHLHRALALARGTGNRGDLVDALTALGCAEQQRGRLAEAQSLFDEALAVLNPLRDRAAEARVRVAIGRNRWLAHDAPGALAALEQALALAAGGAAVDVAASAHQLLVDVQEALGDAAAALRHFRAFHACEQQLHGPQARLRLFEVLAHARLQPLRREVDLQRRRVRDLGTQLELVKKAAQSGT